ncbi:hypothetical protein [Metabacillus rhizolycopersici]|uniref:Uncharacterized protein n=1 Tax=Metabacillus rhizolycopersici TaxID=2875709 RepID=A0ABS7UV73_9BACI|nr:hypothetical protein [Metabacillus rhizolycopersici]MBZ5752188.1 hypothetical protein [Metabacillus rhizolycopersici]
MKKLSKFALILCFTGVLTLSIGFINNKDLNQTEASALLGSPILAEDGDQLLVITVEEQNMVENSSALSGFVPQENGPGFFFEKVK